MSTVPKLTKTGEADKRFTRKNPEATGAPTTSEDPAKAGEATHEPIEAHSEPPTIQYAFLRSDGDSGRFAPKRFHEGDAGWDLAISNPVDIMPKYRAFVHTNLAVAIPKGYVGVIMGRASTYPDRILVVHQTIVDSSFRGEVFLTVYNPGTRIAHLIPGERIAQILIMPVADFEWEVLADDQPPAASKEQTPPQREEQIAAMRREGKLVAGVDKLPPSERGMKGLGSTRGMGRPMSGA